MRTRRFIVLGAVAIVAVVLLIWLAGKSPNMPSQIPTESETVPPSTPHPFAAPDKPEAASSDAKATKTASAPAASSLESLKPKGIRIKEGLAKLNDDDVVLYGRVVDQFGSAVADAIVSGIIQVNNGVRVGTDRMSTATDDNGFFTISGYRGKNLGVNIKKAGYVLSATNTSFVYSHLWPEAERHVPDPKNPVIFKMWKLQGAEPLAEINHHFEIHYTRDPIRFDFLTGKIVPAGGDIEITVDRPAGIVSQQHPQEWSVQLKAIDGGVVETTGAESSVTFIAPEDGYQAILKAPGDPASDGLDRFLFFESRSGQIHGKVRFTFGINNAPDGVMYASFRGVANTNGSRNWEATAPQAP